MKSQSYFPRPLLGCSLVCKTSPQNWPPKLCLRAPISISYFFNDFVKFISFSDNLSFWDSAMIYQNQLKLFVRKAIVFNTYNSCYYIFNMHWGLGLDHHYGTRMGHNNLLLNFSWSWVWVELDLVPELGLCLSTWKWCNALFSNDIRSAMYWRFGSPSTGRAFQKLQ